MQRVNSTLPVNPRRCDLAFTLLELLIGLAILAILAAILTTSLATARQRTVQTQCYANLHALSAAAAAYATDDPRNILLPVHPVANDNTNHDEGFYDYGGATGSPRLWAGTRYGPQGARTAPTRPLNRYVQTDNAGNASRVFQCPADRGFNEPPHSTLLEGENVALTAMPFHEAVGTSYHGNAYRGYGDDETGMMVFWSIGLLLRPATRIPAPSEVVCFSDAALWESLSREPASGGWVYSSFPNAAWHGNTNFNLAYADGHVESLSSAAATFTSGSFSTDPAHWNLQIRRPGTRFDCRPDALLPDAPALPSRRESRS